jgi:hypothetical protein
MNPLSAAALLDVWERGRSVSPVGRGLLLLGAASPGISTDALAALPLGRRDTRLFILRGWTFGSSVEGVVDCPRCAERLELSFDLGELGVLEPGGWGGGEVEAELEGGAQDGESDRAPESAPTGGASRGRRVTVGDVVVWFRLPDSRDLQALEGLDDGVRAREEILKRCVLEVEDPAGRGWTPALAAPVAAAMEEADPRASVQLATTCPDCGHGWETTFDILSWFWDEIDAWGRHMLGEVHVLARAYGWTERDILGMSAWRREYYLRLVAR